MTILKRKSCDHKGCTARPLYGDEDTKKREFSRQHAKVGMADVKGKRCGEQGCTKWAVFGNDRVVTESGRSALIMPRTE